MIKLTLLLLLATNLVLAQDCEGPSCRRRPGNSGAGLRPNPNCVCPAQFSPVCGSDGKQYDNACLAKCAGTQVFCESPCSSCPGIGSSGGAGAGLRPNPNCVCPAQLLPVCGSDGKQYDNACLAKCAGTQVFCESPCSSCPGIGSSGGGGAGLRPNPNCVCPALVFPVCGTDGKEYDNSCLAKCKGVRVACQGPCRNCRQESTISFTNG